MPGDPGLVPLLGHPQRHRRGRAATMFRAWGANDGEDPKSGGRPVTSGMLSDFEGLRSNTTFVLAFNWTPQEKGRLTPPSFLAFN